LFGNVDKQVRGPNSGRESVTKGSHTMTMLAFTTTPDFFFRGLASSTTSEPIVLPSGRFKRDLPIRLSVCEEEVAPRVTHGRVEEDFERWDGLS
jgi:hypothetical protein